MKRQRNGSRCSTPPAGPEGRFQQGESAAATASSVRRPSVRRQRVLTIGIDLGTTNVKGIVFNREEHQCREPGLVDHSPSRLWSECARMEACEEPPKPGPSLFNSWSSVLTGRVFDHDFRKPYRYGVKVVAWSGRSARSGRLGIRGSREETRRSSGKTRRYFRRAGLASRPGPPKRLLPFSGQVSGSSRSLNSAAPELRSIVSGIILLLPFALTLSSDER